MNQYISSEAIGNLFSERQSLIATKTKGANYYNKVLVPFAEYILGNVDTSNYKELNSDLTSKIYHYYYRDKGDFNKRHEVFWKNASSLPRILPIVYFENENNKEYIRLTEIARRHYEGELTCKEFLLLWILRFQGSEYSNKGVLTRANLSIIESCNYKPYKKLINTRMVKPGILALDILERVKAIGKTTISDKQFRNARRLLSQENNEAVEELVNIIINSESSDTSQENQIFNVLEYLGLCEVITYETNNYKFKITGLGSELIRKIRELPFTYYHKSNTTNEFINYYGGMPNKFEMQILEHYRKNGGDFDE